VKLEEIVSRAKDLADFDLRVRGRERGWVAGVDEAGRGALAGPVVAAAVVLRRGASLPGVYDSKQLSPKQREQMFELIRNRCLAMAWAEVGPEVIDERNILRATHQAMGKALGRLPRKPSLVIVDGRPVPGLPCKQVAVVKGDGKSLSVAAASIVAKVVRDRLMTELAETFPQYSFSSNKGYGSREHLLAIEKYGPCELHRKSFSPINPAKERVPDQTLLPL